MRISDAELKSLLLESDNVKPEALKEVENVHEQSGESLLTAVLKRKLISEQNLLKLYAKNIDIPYIDLHGVKIPHDILTKIPERIARKYQAVLFGKTGSTLAARHGRPGGLPGRRLHQQANRPRRKNLRRGTERHHGGHRPI